MPFCPICRAEYRPGFTFCVSCEEPLTETLESFSIPNNRHIETDEFVLLCSLSDDIKANMIMATLQEQRIPALMKTRGAGQYVTIYMGFSIFDKEIWIPSHLEVEAREMLNVFFEEDVNGLQETPFDEFLDFEDFNDPNDSEFYKSFQARRSIGKTIIVFVFFGPIVIGLIYLFIAKLLGN